MLQGKTATCNALCPGWVLTPRVQQIGALVVFLCAASAAQIRGAAVPVDGGWVAQ